MKYGGEEQTKRTKMKNKQKNILICLKNKKTAVQKILPQGTEKPVAGLQPVSRQRMETILPSEKEEGSSVETKNNKAYFNHTAGSQLPKQTCKKYRKKKKNKKTHGRKNPDIKKKDRRTSVCCENNIPTRPHLKDDV